MVRWLFRSLPLSLCLLSLQAETTIRDTIRAPIAGALFNGQLIVSMPDLTWQGQTYRRHNTTVLVTSGALYLRLIPTTADPEGLSYRVQYIPADGSPGWAEFWVVPDTTTELKVYQVNRASQPSTSSSVGLQQIAGARGNSGRALCSDGTMWTSCDLLVNPAFTPGDLLFRGTAGLEALGIGNAGHVLTSQAGRPTWLSLPASEVPLTISGPLRRTVNVIDCPTCFLTSSVLPWVQLSGVPATFAPSAHSHAAGEIISGAFADTRISQSSVTQHQAALAIAWSQLTGLPATFAPATHAHAATDTTSGVFANARISQASVTQHQAALGIGWSQLISVPTSFAPSAHSHAAGEIISGAFADSRISQTSVTQHQAALAIAWSQLTGLPATFAPAAHLHAATDTTSGVFANARISQASVTQHQAALAIAWSQLTGLPATFAPAAHLHAAGEITSGTLADARIAASSVTQHQAALSIAWSQIASAPSFEAPLSFAGGLLRSGNTVVCPTCGGSGSGGGGSYVKTFTAATSVSIPVSDHGFPNDRLIVDCYDVAGERLEPDSVLVNPTTFAVTVFFSPAQSGSCTVAGQPYAGRTLSQSFSGTSVTIPNVAQEIGTPLFSWRVYGADNYWLEPDSTSLDAAGNFTVFVSPAAAGRVVIVAR
jgi:predicted solute-binding protein